MSRKNPFKKIILKENDYTKKNTDNLEKKMVDLKGNQRNPIKNNDNQPLKVVNFNVVKDGNTDNPEKIESKPIEKFEVKYIEKVQSKLIKNANAPSRLIVSNDISNAYNPLKNEKKILNQYYPIVEKTSRVQNDLPKTKIRYIDIIVEKEQKQSILEQKKITSKIEASSHIIDVKSSDEVLIDIEDKIEENMSEIEKDYSLKQIHNVKHNSNDISSLDPINDIKSKSSSAMLLPINGRRAAIRREMDPALWKGSHKPLKGSAEMNALPLYNLMVYLNSINPSVLSRQEQERLISIIGLKISLLKRLISKNGKKEFLIANYNVAGALEKLLINLKRKIKN